MSKNILEVMILNFYWLVYLIKGKLPWDQEYFFIQEENDHQEVSEEMNMIKF